MSDLPASVRREVEAVLGGSGAPVDIVSVTPVGGGCVNHGARLDDRTGRSHFLKWNAAASPELFEAEADGLSALRAADLLRVPAPMASGGGRDGPAWLLMEHVPRGRPDDNFDVRLGHGLARLHASTAHGSTYGWHRDNWIGSLAQANPSTTSWTDLWRDARLAPQLKLARDGGHMIGEGTHAVEALLERLPDALVDVVDAPHLLHGDLWSGNVFAGPDGLPVLIDPAVYLGHGEVDLAMSELFGGFSERFYRAYEEAVGVSPAYEGFRRDIYQLYYLLVHVVLFGAGYEDGATRAAQRALAALRG